MLLIPPDLQTWQIKQIGHTVIVARRTGIAFVFRYIGDARWRVSKHKGGQVLASEELKLGDRPYQLCLRARSVTAKSGPGEISTRTRR